jgi:uncharacterized protein (UPF0332 family)
MTSELSPRELIKRGAIRPCPADHRAAAGLILRASTDLRTAERNLDQDPECAFTYSYTAMMRSGLALMFSRGYRPVAVNKHQTIVQFVSESLGPKDEQIFSAFDLLRNKRNKFIYEPDLPCSYTEAKEALEIAKQFVDVLAEVIESKNGQGRLGINEKKKK